MIAMAMALNPALLIADEPTTALDVTVQAQVLDVMRRLQEEFGTAIILITHDLGVVAEIADEVVVMYAGAAMERAPRRDPLLPPTTTRTPRACWRRCPRQGGARTRLHPDPGAAAEPDQPAAGLPVRARGARTCSTSAGARRRRCVEVFDDPDHHVRLLAAADLAERRRCATSARSASLEQSAAERRRREPTARADGSRPMPADESAP